MLCGEHLSVLYKTLTVEALAACFGRRPALHISSAELGSTVAELETSLTEVLSLEAHQGPAAP